MARSTGTRAASTTPTSACAETGSGTEKAAGDAPIGLLLVNLGSPASPEVADVRRYLREFLSDPRVVEANRLVWWLVLHGLVLPFRAPASARLYRKIWSAEGSPLVAISRTQRDLLAQELGARFEVRLAMRYGEPSIPAAIDELCARGCERVLLFPLFPQYSGTTTGSVYDAVYRELARRRAQPALAVIPPCFAAADYVEALAARVREANAGGEPDHHVFSFHGLPQAYVDRGDPYARQCAATAELLARALGLARDRWTLAFQSRFGREPWLQPYADRIVPALAREHGRVSIAMPGFTADCLETLEEIAIRLREDFAAAGGRELVVVPALNDHPLWLRAMARLARAAAGEREGARAHGSGT